MAQVSGETSANYHNEAQVFAWGYFLYHAQQRQTVFNFYLLLIGGCIAAYASTLGKVDSDYVKFRLFMGAALVFASFVFWRLDQRSTALIKIAEDALKNLEERLSRQTGDPMIRILKRAEARASEWPMSLVESFGQIYRIIFASGALVGAFLFLRVIC